MPPLLVSSDGRKTQIPERKFRKKSRLAMPNQPGESAAAPR